MQCETTSYDKAQSAGKNAIIHAIDSSGASSCIEYLRSKGEKYVCLIAEFFI